MMFGVSQKVRFVTYVPALGQPALSIRLKLQSPGALTPADLATALGRLIAAHLPELPAPAAEVASDKPLSQQHTSVIADSYIWIMRGSGLPVFGRGLIQDVEPQGLSALLPCPAGLHRSATAVLQWLLSAANHVVAGQPLEPKALALGAIVNKLKTQAPPGLNTIRFLEAAYAQGIAFQHIAGNTYQYGWGARARWFDSSFTDVTSTIATNLARDKFATARLLSRAGMPVPKHQFATAVEQALQIASELGYPVVVKPSDKDGGVGVSAGLRHQGQVVRAYQAARQVSKNILVEKHFEGNDYRLQVLHGKVFWAVHRVPGSVVGDGLATIEELLVRINAEPLRGDRGSNALLKRIDLDEEAMDLLEQQGLTPDAIPAADQFVRLRRAANVASGGKPVPVLDVAHPDNLELAERAARLLRLDLAGVDLLIPDIRQSWVKTGAAICEVNAQPQLSPHLPGLILQNLVKDQGRIPVILVLGHLTTLEPSLALASSLSRSGVRVGFASRVRSFVGHPSCVVGIAQTQLAAQGLLFDTRVEAAVISLDSKDLTNDNLALDQVSTLVLMGDPPQKVDAQPLFDTIHQWMALCTGTVYCEKDPAAWGLAQGPRVCQSTPEAAIETISAAVRHIWKDELLARRSATRAA